MFEKVMEYDGDLEVKEGEYLPLDPEDLKGYVDWKLARMIDGSEGRS